MKPKTTKPRKVLDKNYPLLSLKDLLDQIITEEPDLPPDVLSSITQARDSAWKSFILQNETSMRSVNKGQKKTADPS